MSERKFVFKVDVHSDQCPEDFVFGEKEEVIEYLSQYNKNDFVSIRPGYEHEDGKGWTSTAFGFRIPIAEAPRILSGISGS